MPVPRLEKNSPRNDSGLWMETSTAPRPYRTGNVTWTSPTTGYITVACPAPCDSLAIVWHLPLPANHSLMVSFPAFYLANSDHAILKTCQGARGFCPEVWKKSGRQAFLHALIFNSSVQIELIAVEANEYTADLFRVMFSFHPVSQTLRQDHNGLFDCSPPFFPAFHQHLLCNFIVECRDSKDEEPNTCPGCDVTNGKCYQIVRLYNSRSRSQKVCQLAGGDLVTMKSESDWLFVLTWLRQNINYTSFWIGLESSSISFPFYYRNTFVWFDRTAAYHVNATVCSFIALISRVCFYITTSTNRLACYGDCKIGETLSICQRHVIRTPSSITPQMLFPSIDTQVIKSTSSKLGLVLQICPQGHWTHSFLMFDPVGQCGTTQYLHQSSLTSPYPKRGDVTVTWFGCENGRETVPYTLLCDYRPDCLDASDETFCVHRTTCSGFTCRNGQCLKQSQFCDAIKDCWDGSDEECEHVFLMSGTTRRLPSPTIIDFLGGSGNYSQWPTDAASPCPDTHFRCSDGNCLPVFVRCNGVYDCLDKQDEAQCYRVTCPGYYRCRSSSVCVHPQHLCDGLPQCPQHDDEWLCHAVCPTSCLCQGLIFVCQSSFVASYYPDLRYLDATGSGMTPSDVINNTYLTWLSFASCSLSELHHLDFSNLRSLDLSKNNLSAVSMDVFRSMNNLRNLSMSSNPLTSLIASYAMNISMQLLFLDLSFTRLRALDGRMFKGFPLIQILNASFCLIDTIAGGGLGFNLNLHYVDLRGNTVKTFPIGLFTHHHQLQAVSTDNYKLCCRASLPSHLDDAACDAPRDDVSSCEDLLRSDVYRFALWLFSAMSIMGNMGSFLFRLLISRASFLSSYNIFVSSLSLTDLTMGAFLAIIGAADIYFRGQYFRTEDTWKNSQACETAGFLSLMSYETSAALVCVITLDRFIVLRFPFSRLRFTRQSAVVACLVILGMGILLAALPISSITSDWQFYRQTGICVPLPVTRRRYRGQHYVFGVMIVFNLLLFLTIASGQLLIYWTVRNTSRALRQDTQNVIINNDGRNKDLRVARRLTYIVVTAFLCWFPVGLLGVLAACGVPVPVEVPVALAILVLPLNSALNPLLYTLNMLQERWHKLEESRLLKQLQDRINTTVNDVNIAN